MNARISKTVAPNCLFVLQQTLIKVLKKKRMTVLEKKYVVYDINVGYMRRSPK